MASLPADGSSDVRAGALPRVWQVVILLSLYLALHWTAQDLYALRACPGLQPRLGWPLYFVAQLLNKLPVSYRYSPRGLVAAADLLGFLAGMTSVALFYLQVPVAPVVSTTLVNRDATPPQRSE